MNSYGGNLTWVPYQPGERDIKWQVSGSTTAGSESTDLRLVSYVSDLDMKAVSFNVTVGDKTTSLSCTAVYSAINADGLSVDDAPAVFGTEKAAYFVTYVIKNIPSSAFGEEIQVSVTWTDAQGNVTTSDARSIVISDAIE